MKIAFSLYDISIICQARNLFISYSNKSINWVVIDWLMNKDFIITLLVILLVDYQLAIQNVKIASI